MKCDDWFTPMIPLHCTMFAVLVSELTMHPFEVWVIFHSSIENKSSMDVKFHYSASLPMAVAGPRNAYIETRLAW